MNKTAFLSLSVAVAFAACSETDNSSGQQPAPERLIKVEVSENPLADEATGGTTRSAAMTTTATLDKFAMNYQTSTYNFTKTGDTWSTPDWPNVENSDKIDFYAYTDGSFNYNSGSPYLSFTVDENVSSQHDLLVAVHKEIAYSDNDNGTEGTYLEVNYTTSGAKTATIPLNVNWQAGHLYTINIKLGTTTITP